MTRSLATVGALAAAGAIALSGCGGDDDDGGGDDLQAFCDQVEELRASDPFAGLEGSNDLDAVNSALEESQSQIDSVAEVAPEEVQGDVEQIQTFFDDFVSEAQNAETPQDLIQIATQFQDRAQEFQATIQRLEDYTNENCGEEGS